MHWPQAHAMAMTRTALSEIARTKANLRSRIGLENEVRGLYVLRLQLDAPNDDSVRLMRYANGCSDTLSPLVGKTSKLDLRPNEIHEYRSPAPVCTPSAVARLTASRCKTAGIVNRCWCCHHRTTPKRCDAMFTFILFLLYLLMSATMSCTSAITFARRSMSAIHRGYIDSNSSNRIAD